MSSSRSTNSLGYNGQPPNVTACIFWLKKQTPAGGSGPGRVRRQEAPGPDSKFCCLAA